MRSTAALDINLFKQKVNRAIKTIDQNVVQTLMGGFKGKFVSSVAVRKFE
jgi:hypothetical protein